MKKRLISIIAAAVMVTAVLSGCGTKDNAADDNKADGSNTGAGDDTIIVGTEAGFAPYEYMEGNEVVGIDMDIAQAIADYLGKELVIRNMDFDGALLAVQSGQVDFVAAGVSYDEKRDEVMDFSEEYINSTEVVVVNAAEPAVASVEDLDGKIIGVQQGNIADFWVEENTEAKEIKRYTKFAQAAEDLKNRKIDCIVMDQFPAEELVAANPDLAILDGTLFEDKYAIAVDEGNKELLDKINEVIKDLKDSGKMDDIIASHTGK